MTKSYCKLTTVAAFAIIVMSACATVSPQQSPTLNNMWTLTGLESPESILPSRDGAFYYVSNVNGEGDEKDGNGYIARVSKSGSIIEQRWATGLNAPKGLGLDGTTLYVSDIDHLVVIDTETGNIITRVEAPGAGFLNDTSVSQHGIFVADSANSRIYEYTDGSMSVWLEDTQLGGVNGLLAQNDRLLITTMNDGELLSLDWATKTLTSLAGDMEDADGLAQLEDGSFLVSSWPGTLYHVKPDGTNAILLDTKADNVFLNDFYYDAGTLIIPNWQPGSLRAYDVINKP